jgi:hypothetical protein
MFFQFKVSLDGKSLFQNTFEVPDDGPEPVILGFARMAYAKFKKAHPEVSLSDPGLKIEWVRTDKSPRETELPKGGIQLRN